MDAVSLALPTNTLAGTALAAGDKGAALPVDAQGAPIDFAALLAAGLTLQQQQLPAPMLPAQAPAEDRGVATEELLDPTGANTDPTQLLATASALPTVAAVLEPGIPTGRPAERDDGALGNGVAVPVGPAAHERAKSATVAADAASFAAAAGDESNPVSGARFQAELTARAQIAELTDTRRAEASAEAAVHALNVASGEQRPAIQQPTAVLEVAAPLSSAGFADAVSQQVVWMVDKDAQVAELRINPPELGPVEVRLTVNGDQASAQFVATHQDVRTALEASIARLRESFAEAGIQLGQASVSAESFRDQSSGQPDARGSHRPGYAAAATTNEAHTASVAAPVRRGLVDTFA